MSLYAGNTETGVYVGEEKISGGGGMEELWSNSTPSAAFISQKIPIVLTNYSAIVIEFIASTTLPNFINRFYFKTGEVRNAESSFCNMIISANLGLPIVRRQVVSIDETGVTFSAGYGAENGVYTVNTNVIPIKIYGIK